jgi:hypothetical protein
MKSFEDYDFLDKKYRLNFWILKVACILCLALLFIIFYQDGFSGKSHGFSYCANNSANRESNGCFNGFYNSTQCLKDIVNKSSPLCTTIQMYPGERLGEEPSWYFKYIWYLLGGIFLLALILNSLIYNRHYLGGSPPINKGDVGIGGSI